MGQGSCARGRRTPGKASGPLALVAGAGALSLALVLVSLADASGLRRLSSLREDAARAEAANAALRAENARLLRTAQKLGARVDAAALERAAREQLGFVKRDELLFKFE